MARRIHTIVAAAVSIALGSSMGVQAAFAGTTSSDPPPVTFTSPNPQLHGLFGLSVAVSGGIKVVGAPSESATVMGATIAGAGQAYIFDAPTGTLIATLTSPNAQADGGFGDSVAVISDPVLGTSVVVGAPGESVGAIAQAGHAYVFSGTGTPIATLSSTFNTGTSNAQLDGLFGFSVAVTIFSSGVSTVPLVVVGAPGETAGGVSGAGNFYTFRCDPICGSFGGPVSSLNPQVNGQFGSSVSASGTTASSVSIVVGSPNENVGVLSQAGNAYLCGLQSFGPSCQTTLTSPNAQALGQFGTSVAVSGNTVVVGAQNENVTVGGVITARAGHAYLFDTTGALIATLASPNPQTPGAQGSGGFGASVALSGISVVVGSPGESASGFNGAGHAYLFVTTGTLIATLGSPNAVSSGRFGTSVADDDAPRRTNVLVGAPTEPVSGLDSAGHAYLFVRLKI